MTSVLAARALRTLPTTSDQCHPHPSSGPRCINNTVGGDDHVMKSEDEDSLNGKTVTLAENRDSGMLAWTTGPPMVACLRKHHGHVRCMRVPLAEWAHAGDLSARFYTQRPRSRLQCIARALDACALSSTPEKLPPSFLDEVVASDALVWHCVFGDQDTFVAGLAMSQMNAKRFRRTKSECPLSSVFLAKVQNGTYVVKNGRVLLQGVKLARALRFSKAAAKPWGELGAFLGQHLSSVIFDTDTASSGAAAAGGWIGSVAGTIAVVSVDSTMATSVASSVAVATGMGAAGALAGAGTYIVIKKYFLRDSETRPDRTSQFYDGELRLFGAHDAGGSPLDHFGVTLEFDDVGKPETESHAGDERMVAVGWYSLPVAAEELS